MVRLVFILTLLCTLLSNTYAQKLGASFERRYFTAVEKYKKGQIKKADGILKSLAHQYANSPEVFSKLGEFYFDHARYRDAAYYFEMGSKSVNNGAALFSIPLARAYFRAGVPARASLALRSFPKSSQTPQAVLNEVQDLQKSIEFSQLVSYNTHNVTLENLRWPINSALDEYAPSYSGLTKDMVFTRKINGVDENFFIAHLDSCNLWEYAVDMGFPLNSNKPESYQNRAFSNKYIIFQKCDNRSVNARERGGCDLYLAYANKNGWSDPRPFFYTINTIGFEGMPSLNASENCLYFVSDRPGGYGGKDIWKSYFVNNRWQVPINLGPNVNTEKDELAPSIAADGTTLFFSSNGRPGFGGMDIYMSKILADSSMSLAVNIGAPINSFYDELSGSLSLDGKSLFFASDRVGGFGGFDIYKAEIPKPFLPKPMTLVYGRVHQLADNKAVTDATIFIQSSSSPLDTFSLSSNKGDGSFYLALPKFSSFDISIDHDNYLPIKDSFSTRSEPDVDSLDYTMLMEGENRFVYDTVQLMTLDYKVLSENNEDSICLGINEQLKPFSGLMVKVFVDAYFPSADATIVKQFDASLMNCFYKMGISDDYFQFQNWEIFNEELSDKIHDNKKGSTVIKVAYRRDLTH